MRRNQRGFTLMELMVVIVIVAILAAVAVPLYINYVKDAKRSEAKGAIAAIISAEQVHYQKSCVKACTYTLAAGDEFGTIDIAEIIDEAGRNWDIEITNADANTFTIEATGKDAAAGLGVKCDYNRTTGATWTDTDPATP